MISIPTAAGILRTRRLILRRPGIQDAESIFKAYTADPEVSKYMTWLPHRSLAESRAFITMINLEWLDSGNRVWVITPRGLDQAVGTIGFEPAGDQASIGYVVGRAFWNRGWVTEALKALLDEMGRIGFRRAYAVYDTENPASGRVMAKAGMKFRGRLPKFIVHPGAGSGRRDVFLYEKGLCHASRSGFPTFSPPPSNLGQPSAGQRLDGAALR